MTFDVARAKNMDGGALGARAARGEGGAHLKQ